MPSCACPFASAPITGASPLLRAGPPARAATVLSTSRFLPPGALPLAALPAAGQHGSIGTRLIAVGTALAGGPPRRSQRAELPHWAPASGTNAKAHVREGMRHAGGRQPPIRQAVHALPVQAGALAAAPQRLVPVPCHLGAERRHRLAVAGHGVVSAVPSHHAAQPPPLLRDRLMHALPQLVLDLCQLRPHPFRDRDTPHPEAPVPHLRANVREAEEVERLRFPGAPLLPV